MSEPSRAIGADPVDAELRPSRVVNETGAEIAGTQDLAELLGSVVDIAARLTGAETGAFVYADRGHDGEALTLSAFFGHDRGGFESGSLPTTPESLASRSSGDRSSRRRSRSDRGTSNGL